MKESGRPPSRREIPTWNDLRPVYILRPFRRSTPNLRLGYREARKFFLTYWTFPTHDRVTSFIRLLVESLSRDPSLRLYCRPLIRRRHKIFNPERIAKEVRPDGQRMRARRFSHVTGRMVPGPSILVRSRSLTHALYSGQRIGYCAS